MEWNDVKPIIEILDDAQGHNLLRRAERELHEAEQLRKSDPKAGIDYSRDFDNGLLAKVDTTWELEPYWLSVAADPITSLMYRDGVPADHIRLRFLREWFDKVKVVLGGMRTKDEQREYVKEQAYLALVEYAHIMAGVIPDWTRGEDSEPQDIAEYQRLRDIDPAEIPTSNMMEFCQKHGVRVSQDWVKEFGFTDFPTMPWPEWRKAHIAPHAF
jgi:hypothetical protein